MKHNVLLIEVDQMNAGCLSLLGHPDVRTPRLDDLARQGVLFGQAVCNFPLCLPSRISMLSGLYPSTNGQFGNDGNCDVGIRWLPNVLRDAGYATAAFGKFHVAPIGQGQWGFDVAASSLPEDEAFARPEKNTYRAYCAKKGIPWPTDQIHGHNPFGAPPPMPPGVEPWMVGERRRACRSAVRAEDGLENWTTNVCLDYLESAVARVEPFFIWLSYDRPHWPTALPANFEGRLNPERLTLRRPPTEEEMKRLPPHAACVQASSDSILQMGEEAFRFVLATYFALIELIDQQIGRVLDKLKELGQDENTTILFLSDHGDENGHHGLLKKQMQSSSDPLNRVPLMIRVAPALKCPGNRIVSAPVELVDLYPTLCTLTGVVAPSGLEGRDLTPVLKGEREPDPERPVFSENYHKKTVYLPGWKLVFDALTDKECQLYDLNNDPECYRNLYGEDGLVSQRMRLKQALLTFLSERRGGTASGNDDEGGAVASEAELDRVLRKAILRTPAHSIANVGGVWFPKDAPEGKTLIHE